MVDPCWQQTEISDHKFQRVFRSDLRDQELVWHRDHHDRSVRVIHNQGWQLQMDNQLPVLIQTGQEFKIPALVFHRLIRGSGDLIVEITQSVMPDE
jgi:hypothetical protein